MCSRAITLVLAVLPLSCAVARTPAQVEARLQADAVTIVRDERFTLYSPYAAEPTAEFSAVISEQTRELGALFDQAGAPPVRLYLLASATDDAPTEHRPWEAIVHDGRAGVAVDTGFAAVYVPTESSVSQARVWLAVNKGSLRHEIAHLCEYRLGLVRGRWFNEGLAQHVEAGIVEANRLVPDPFPVGLLLARESADVGSAATLLHWSHADELTQAEMVRRYVQSEALFRFLVERAHGAYFLESARRVHTLADEAILALEPEWLAWLASCNVLDAIEHGLHSQSADERARCAAKLPVLAEQHAHELSRRAADELALGLLDDAATVSSATTFLVYFRARALTEDDVKQLASSPSPTRRLTAFALRSRRDEAFDLAAAQALWDGLPPESRTILTAVAAQIRGLERW